MTSLPWRAILPPFSIQPKLHLENEVHFVSQADTYMSDNAADLKALEAQVEFANNPEPRCACVLLLDTSGSMQGDAINALNEGLKFFKTDLAKDPVASSRVEVAVVSFNDDVTVVTDFATADKFEPPTLTAGGTTHMAAGILKALDLIQERKALYKANGVAYYRLWVFMITDGESQGETDEIIRQAGQRIKDDENGKRVAFFAVGVEGANMEKLSGLVQRTAVKLRGLNFIEMFIWLSKSAQGVARSQLDQQVALPPPGWGAV